ncbi:hypothetical protein Tco_0894260 [Tanacetum coccineum]|uniref:Uncharacterized protein n=1 Tax=Tanacetum coccineum TaxID=301880 RepID=A0ABQ5CCI4_9ASTR
MDKSWMETNRISKSYVDGVAAFTDYAVHNLQKTGNIDPRTKHGEEDEPSISAPKPVNATTEFVDDMDFAYIPTDGPATVEMVNATKDNFDVDDLVKFQELLLDVEKPLYEEKIGKRKLRKIIDISSDSSDDRRWAAKKASALVFYGPSTQGLLDAYGYGTIEEYLEWNYFPSTDNESTNMETTDKDCIDDSNSAMSKGKYVPVCKKNNPNVYSHVPVTGCVLGLASVTTWDEIEKKMGARKTKTCADKAKGKRKVSCGS